MPDVGDSRALPIYRWARQLLNGDAAVHEMREVAIAIDGVVPDVVLANALAEQVAARLCERYLLLAWHDGRCNESCPSGPPEQQRPGWLVYAEQHGGNIRVRVNEGEFDFVFAGFTGV